MPKVFKEQVPFTQVSNAPINDLNLSFKAIGLYTYIASKPDGWVFSANRIANRVDKDSPNKKSKDKRESILSGLRELEHAGYLKRVKKQDGSTEYQLFHSNTLPANEAITPKSENPTEGKPQSRKTPQRENPTEGKPDSINNKEYYSNKEYISNTNKKKVNKEKDLISLNELEELKNYSNSYFPKQTRKITGLLKNFISWRENYTLEEMKLAARKLGEAKSHFWKDKMNLTIFLRQTNKSNEPVDYISDLLSIRSNEATGSETDRFISNNLVNVDEEGF